jgi:hypothetical protein
MQTQLQKQKESTITTATVQQKSIENTGFTLQDNRATPNAITQLQEVTQLGDKKRFKKGKKSKTKKTKTKKKELLRKKQQSRIIE